MDLLTTYPHKNTLSVNMNVIKFLPLPCKTYNWREEGIEKLFIAKIWSRIMHWGDAYEGSTYADI